jgi:hypothetical protein
MWASFYGTRIGRIERIKADQIRFIRSIRSIRVPFTPLPAHNQSLSSTL